MLRSLSASISIFFILSGCSGLSEKPALYNGKFLVYFFIDRNIPNSEQFCSNGRGEIVIKESFISGELNSFEGINLSVSGLIDDVGVINKGLATSSFTIAKYTGIMVKDGGGGRWEDANGCRGNWNAYRID